MDAPTISSGRPAGRRPALLQLRLSNFEANFSRPQTPTGTESKPSSRPGTPRVVTFLSGPPTPMGSGFQSRPTTPHTGGPKPRTPRTPHTARTPRTPCTPRTPRPASEMEISDIPRLTTNSLFFPWDRGLRRYLRAQELDAHISRNPPREPFRADYAGKSEWEREIIRPEGDFAGKKAPSGRALEGGGELTEHETKEWATWARNELRTRQALLKSIASTMVLEVNTLWSAHDIYLALKNRFTDDRAHRALVWKFLRLRFPQGEEITCDRLRAHVAEFSGMVNELHAMGRPREDSQIVAQFLSSIPDEFAWTLVTALQTARGDAWPVIHKAFMGIVKQLEAQEATKQRRRGRRGQQHPYHANFGRKVIAQFLPDAEQD